MNNSQKNQTPLAAFIGRRLDDLKLKQADFCRNTGFDQGMLSKIQSGLAKTISLETALRLAIGLSVPPESILDLIGGADLHALVQRAYGLEPAGEGK